ncbi:MAG: CYTH domain-containing protein [Eubacteriales bacterium]|nr:CYTH domain-containing protein [Eubacteriales bacterium]
METEIKLRLRNETELLDAPENSLISRLIMPDSRREMELINLYYDTASHDLTNRMMSLRLRQEGDDNIITLKSGDSSENELHQRFEWSACLPESSEDGLEAGLDTAWFKREATSNGDPDSQLMEALKLLKGQPLKAICEARFTRISIDIGYGDSLMELALDRGELIVGDRSEPVCEMEIELKEGDVRDLVELGQEIQAILPAEPELLSKFARCIALLNTANAQ